MHGHEPGRRGKDETTDRFLVSLADAAKMRRVDPSVFQQLVEAGRIEVRMKGGSPFLRRTDVAIELENEPPSTPLDVVQGSVHGTFLSVKHLGAEMDGQSTEEGTKEGELTLRGGVSNWRRVAVRIGGRKPDGTRQDARTFVLIPYEEEDFIVNGPFYVKGRFLKIPFNNRGEAHQEWETYIPK